MTTGNGSGNGGGDEPTKINKRLAFLEKVTADGSEDPLAWYGLAMEYRKMARWGDALRTFTALRARKPDYIAMYLMCGQMLLEASRKDEGASGSRRGSLRHGRRGTRTRRPRSKPRSRPSMVTSRESCSEVHGSGTSRSRRPFVSVHVPASVAVRHAHVWLTAHATGIGRHS